MSDPPAAALEERIDEVLKKFDTDGDGALSLEEVRGLVAKVCSVLDIAEPVPIVSPRVDSSKDPKPGE